MDKKFVNEMTLRIIKENTELPTVVRNHILDTMNRSISYEELVSHTSGEFLTENITVIDQLSIDDSDEFVHLIEDRLTEQYEGYNSADVWKMIIDSADSLKRFLKFKGIEVK